MPAGEVYHPIEGSKGELGVYIKSDGGPKPARVHVRGPSFVNLSALPLMCEGEMVADVVASHRLDRHRARRNRQIGFRFWVLGVG